MIKKVVEEVRKITKERGKPIDNEKGINQKLTKERNKPKKNSVGKE